MKIVGIGARGKPIVTEEKHFPYLNEDEIAEYDAAVAQINELKRQIAKLRKVTETIANRNYNRGQYRTKNKPKPETFVFKR